MIFRSLTIICLALLTDAVAVARPVALNESALYSLGTGIPILSTSDAGMALNIEGLFSVSQTFPLYVGMEIGYFRMAKSFGSQEATLDVFHFAPTALVRFPVSPRMRMYGGLLIGPAAATATATPIFDSRSAFKIAFAVRPGMEYELNPMFSIAGEIRMGAASELDLNRDTMKSDVDAQKVVGTGFLLYPMIRAILKF